MRSQGYNDAVRLIFVIGPGFFLVAQVLVVIKHYTRAFIMDIKISRATGRQRMGLLPGHVALIGSSYLIALLGAVVDTMIRLDQQFGWRLWYRAAFIYLGIAALISMARYQRKRYEDVV